MTIDHDRFQRLLFRCEEIASEDGISPVVAHVYDAALRAPAKAYLTASIAITQNTMAFAKEHTEAINILSLLEGPYKVAQSTVRAALPETTKTLPETLKRLSTDTDQVKAIADLLDIVKGHAKEPWAVEILAGSFGLLGTRAVKKITEAIAASKALAKAQTERANAYGPAYQKYVAFKKVVRDTLGPSSKQYRRIDLLASPGASSQDEDDIDPALTPSPTPSPVTATASASATTTDAEVAGPVAEPPPAG